MAYKFARPSHFSYSRCVNEGKTLFFGLVFSATADGGVVTVYDGIDAVSGTVRYVLTGKHDEINQLVLDPPVLFENGLYIVPSGTTDYITAHSLSAEEPVVDQS
jgi:hypothetical protein